MSSLPAPLERLRASMPHRPYCTDDLGAGLRIRERDRAQRARYCQFNPPALVHWLICDVDRPEAGAAWLDAGLPPPAWTAINPTNSHAHIAYGLCAPVCRSDAARLPPLRYVAAIERGLVHTLGADPGYAELLTKNPMHPDWVVRFPAGTAANAGCYELGELAEWVPLLPSTRRISGLGRNCELFERLRNWAYRAIRQGWPDYDQWLRACLARAEGYNTFAVPLPYAEVKATAKSVAKWTHRRFSPAAFSAIQAERGRKGGKKSRGGGRPRKYANRAEQARAFRARKKQE